MQKYRKKPVEIEAIQTPKKDEPFNAELLRLVDDHGWHVEDGQIIIPTLEGNMTASPNDWIIKGVSNEFYPCKPDIFEQTYDKV